MHDYQPFSVIGFHSCDREVALKILNGKDDFKNSDNAWDWLGSGIYFWEQNPLRAWEYGIESAHKKQFNKVPIKTLFVLGAIIDLGNCLNLVESGSLKILSSAYNGLQEAIKDAGEEMPVNKGNNRALDCAVIQYIHQSNKEEKKSEYDTVRCAFSEGDAAYPTSVISTRQHMQICVRNPECIKGVFLPRPLYKFNPNL